MHVLGFVKVYDLVNEVFCGWEKYYYNWHPLGKTTVDIISVFHYAQNVFKT